MLFPIKVLNKKALKTNCRALWHQELNPRPLGQLAEVLLKSSYGARNLNSQVQYSHINKNY